MATMMGQFGILMALITSFIHVTHAISGHATPYKGAGFPSTCNKTNANQGNQMFVTVSSSMFVDGYRCGFKYLVHCSSDQPTTRYPCSESYEGVIVTIVGLCESCESLDMVLSKEAFFKIAAPDAEEIFVDYAMYSGD